MQDYKKYYELYDKYNIDAKMFVISSPLTGLWNVLVLYKDDVIEGWIANENDGIMHHVVGIPNEEEYEDNAVSIILNEATEWIFENDKESAKH